MTHVKKACLNAYPLLNTPSKENIVMVKNFEKVTDFGFLFSFLFKIKFGTKIDAL